MTEEAQAIEVEVVAIDGVAPLATAESERTSATRQPWQDLQARVLRLDSRWWPLWVVLGTIAIALLLTVGVVVGSIYLICRILIGILNAIIR